MSVVVVTPVCAPVVIHALGAELLPLLLFTSMFLPRPLVWTLTGAPHSVANHRARRSGVSELRLQLTWMGGGGRKPHHLLLVVMMVWCEGFLGLIYKGEPHCDLAAHP